MRKFRPSATVIGMTAIGVTATLTLAAVPAQAASSIPGPAQSCSSGQPKLDYRWDNAVGAGGWSNVCGTGTWTWNEFYAGGQAELDTLRMPTTPYHRIWLHQNADNTGLNVCFYSQNNDIDLTTDKYGEWTRIPGNVQVSANTSPC